MDNIPTLEDIRNAEKRIGKYIHRTPILSSASINNLSGIPGLKNIYFKCENFQKGGSFKIRGACNTVLSLENDEASNGVLTHSSGNHAAALALAAGIRGIPAYIVMPSTAADVKKAAVAGYGGKITFCKPTMDAREETAEKVFNETKAVMVHPFDDYRIIAGAATSAKEFLEDAGDLDFLLVPTGGGGLLSGTSLAAHYINPGTKVIGCEPKNADDAHLSFKSGEIIHCDNPDTIADGLRTTKLSEKTFGIIRKYVHDIITVTEEEIIEAMRIVWERMKIIIEPSSAVAVAPVLSGKIDAQNKNVGIIISGGNIDLGNLPF